MLGLFAVLIFSNATLLFVVQPMFTKLVLPLLGGTPAVWNTCLMFFQAALLVGYLYAHATSKRLTPRAQGMLHLALMLLALVFLPLGVPSGIEPPPGMAAPVVWLLVLLTITLGLPFVLLSAGAPMFQRWLAATSHPAAGNPYVLYVASNLGSFAALIAYPTLIEPVLRLGQQRMYWAYGYYGLVALVGLTLWLTLRTLREKDTSGDAMVPRNPGRGERLSSGGPPMAPMASMASQESPTPGAVPPAPQAPASVSALPDRDDFDVPTTAPSIIPTKAWRLRWVLLSFAPSSLLIGVTTFLSTDVAAVPLLWVVPLALYLLTFVLVFAERPLLGRRFMLVFQLLVALALLVIIGMTPTRLRLAHLALHLIGFFATAMVCHRELADSRPRADHLTEFYLWMSVGGLLGGVFNVVLAPLMYDRVLEYPFALIVALGLRPVATRQDTGLRAMLLDLALPVGLYLALLASFQIQVPAGRTGTVAMWTLFTIAALVLATFHRRPLRLALGAAALFVAVDGRGRTQDAVYQERSFFGVYRVHRWDNALVLQHGTTTHGAQSLRADTRREPLTYYARRGPLGDAFSVLTDTMTLRNVALVGLGTGTTACYSRPFEMWTYYEIDPVIARMATSGRLFTYMSLCGPTHRVRLGDARLRLREAADSSYDLIALDAFSSDAIPVHLMTREALQLYLRKLKPNGTILFHISNRYLDLEPVVARLARDAGLAAAERDYDPTSEEKLRLFYASRWIALSRESAILAPLVADHGWRILQADTTLRPWTDDYSDIVSVLKGQ